MADFIIKTREMDALPVSASTNDVATPVCPVL